MHKNASVDITHHSTFQLKSMASDIVSVGTRAVLQEAMKKICTSNVPYAILGGGSNILFASLVKKLLIIPSFPGIDYQSTDTETFVVVGAGVLWDEFVLDTVEKGYGSLVLLSAIPGSVGAAPVQNIGAYGAEVSDYITELCVYDIAADAFRTISATDCGFGYRMSNFKTIWTGRYIIVSVTFLVSKNAPLKITYPGVAALVPTDQLLTPLLLRNTIIAIRWSKLPNPLELPNVGSFFQNPILSIEQVASLLTAFPTLPVFESEQTGMKKISAGWLIEQCGWKGKRCGPVGMYEKNALVMVNYGDATLDNVLELQKNIQDSVQEKFGVVLVREPSIIE